MFVMVFENVLQNLIGVGERKMFNVFSTYINACSFPQDFFSSILFPSPFLWGLTQGMWQKQKISNGSLLITEHNQTI